jgi:uncharacterized protein (DUF2336 family)
MMGRLQERLPEMFALAHERSDGARVQLAGMVADVFLNDNAQLNSREEQLVNELIDQLLQMRNPAVRSALVGRFVDARRMPRKVAMNLACDAIDVARSVLTTSTTLTDNDLITVIDTQSRDHAKAVAVRASVSEAVADALVVTGDAQIMQMVAENLGAKLSVRAIDVLADAARFAMELREPLARRPEMTAEASTRLFWWVSQDLRRYMLKRFGIPSGQIDEALAHTIDELLGHHELEKNNDAIMAQVADWLGEHQAIAPQILPQVLRLGHFRLFNILLGRMVNLNVSLVDVIVAGTGGRTLAVVCRALGIDKSGFVSIFLLSRGARPGEQIVHPRELSHALAAFDRLSVPMAQDLLRSWKEDPSYLLQRRDDLALED